MDTLINERGRNTFSPFQILSTHQPRSPAPKNPSANMNTIHVLNLIPENTIAPQERLVQGNDVRLGGDAGAGAIGDHVHAERLAHDGVEIRERVEFIHRRYVVRKRLELRAKRALDDRVARELEECPGRCG
jgi:hypothetical protein